MDIVEGTNFFSDNKESLSENEHSCSSCYYSHLTTKRCSLNLSVSSNCSNWTQFVPKQKIDCTLTEVCSVIIAIRSIITKASETGEYPFRIIYEDTDTSVNSERNEYLDILNVAFHTDVSDNYSFFVNYIMTLEPFMFMEKISLCNPDLGRNAFGYIFCYPCAPGSLYIKLSYSSNKQLVLVSYHKEHSGMSDYRYMLRKTAKGFAFPEKIVAISPILHFAVGSSLIKMDCLNKENEYYTCDINHFTSLYCDEVINTIESLNLDLLYGLTEQQNEQIRIEKLTIETRFKYVAPITTVLMGSCANSDMTECGKVIALYGLWNIWATDHTYNLLSSMLKQLSKNHIPKLLLDMNLGDLETMEDTSEEEDIDGNS